MTSYIEQVAQGVLGQLRDGRAPWQKDWPAGQRFMPYNPVNGQRFKAINAVWLASRAEDRGYDDPRWMTAKHAAALGGYVREGERGEVIQAWQTHGTEPLTDRQGRVMTDERGQPRMRRVRYESPRVFTGTVFNAAQIEGLPPTLAPVLAASERREAAARIIEASGAAFEAGVHPSYRLRQDVILMPDRRKFSGPDEYQAAALHQLVHWTGHPARFARDLAHPFGSEGYAREELRAGIASLMIGDRLGLGYRLGDHAAYAALWIRVIERDPRELFRAAAEAGRIEQKLMAFEMEQRQEREAGGQEWPDGAPASVAASVASVKEGHPAMVVNSNGGERTYLVVPYTERNDAKAAGARWDKAEKAWYVPAGVPLDGFSAWMPGKGQAVHVETPLDPVEQFAEALREAGLQVQGAPVMDGTMQRVTVAGDHGKERSGAYKGFLDGHPAGYIENFRTGFKTNWKASGKVQALTAQDRERLAAEADEKRRERARSLDQLHRATAQEVAAIWSAALPAPADHPYLASKSVSPHGIGQDQAGNLLVPVQDADGNLWSLQRITPSGQKGFKENGKAEGGHFVIGALAQPGPLLIAEGFATGATVHELTGQPVIVAFNSGNLPKVAAIYRARFPDRAIYIAGDNDHAREEAGKPNVGKLKAEEAAAAIGGRAILPIFAQGENGSDWNDLARNRGRDDARMWLKGAMRVAEHYLARQAAERKDREVTPNKEAGIERELAIER